MWDIEVCPLVQVTKQQLVHTPVHISLPRIRNPAGEMATPSTPVTTAKLYLVGSACNSFRTPQQRSPLTPRVSQRLLESLDLVLMDDVGEPSSPVLPISASSSASAATTLTCSTEGLWYETP